MEQCRGQGGWPDSKISQDLSHGDWVRDVRLATLAKLPLVCTFSYDIGLFYDSQVSFGMIELGGAKKFVNLKAMRSPASEKSSEPAPNGTDRSGSFFFGQFELQTVSG